MSNIILNQPTTNRIEFIDLAKGICILLVVVSHCHINIPFLQYIRMPLYFILSGLFFKQYDGFINFTIRKTNKILIPFLFFYIVSFLLYTIISHFAPDIRINSAVEKFYFLDPLYSRLCINSPLWFLLSLFLVNLMYYVIFIFTKNKLAHAVFVTILAICAYLCKSAEIFLPLYLEKSLYYIPFFFAGYYLKNTDILIENPLTEKRNLIIGIVTLGIFFVLALLPLKEELHTIRFYFTALSGVIALLLILKKIKKLPFISFFGRYSIIILCTSFWIYQPLLFITSKLSGIYTIGGVRFWSLY